MSTSGRLTAEQGFKYRAASRIVVLELLEPLERERAAPASRQAVFRMLVGKIDDGHTEPYDPQVFCPFVFVSNTVELITGRELFGYPSLLASFADGVKGTGAKTLAVEVSVFKDETSNQPSDEPVIEIEWPNGSLSSTSDVAAEWLWRDQDIFPAFRKSFLATWRKRLPKGYSTIQLKQVRDAPTPMFACYQALVESDHDISTGDMREQPRALVRLGNYRSLKIESDLGLQLNGTFESYRGTYITRTRAPRRVTGERGPAMGRNSRPVCYRQRGDTRLPPPYTFRDVSVVGFKLPANETKLRELCDVLLNADRDQGFRYEPASNQVVMEVLRYPSMRSAAQSQSWIDPPPWLRDTDTVSQKELTFRILVGKIDEDSRDAREPAVFCPFLFVDSDWSLLSGREVVGFPKALARIDEPAKPESPGKRAVDHVQEIRIVQEWPGMKGADAIERPPDVRIEYKGIDPYRPVAAQLDEAAGSGIRGIQPWQQEDFTEQRRFRRRFAGDWLKVRRNGFRMLQLKQIRDSADPATACYRELVEGEYEATNIRIAQPSGTATITFSAELQRLRKELGLDNDTYEVTAGHWYRAECDFDLQMVNLLE